MDPELAKLITALGVPAIGVIGVALGAWIAQSGIKAVADRNADALRQVDLRKWQESLIHPLIDLEGRRLAIFYQVLDHLRRAAGGMDVNEFYKQLVAEELILDRLPFWDLGNQDVRAALASLRNYDESCMDVMRQMVTVGGMCQ
jgi:hypothetical protein